MVTGGELGFLRVYCMYHGPYIVAVAAGSGQHSRSGATLESNGLHRRSSEVGPRRHFLVGGAASIVGVAPPVGPRYYQRTAGGQRAAGPSRWMSCSGPPGRQQLCKLYKLSKLCWGSIVQLLISFGSPKVARQCARGPRYLCSPSSPGVL